MNLQDKEMIAIGQELARSYAEKYDSEFEEFGQESYIIGFKKALELAAKEATKPEGDLAQQIQKVIEESGLVVGTDPVYRGCLAVFSGDTLEKDVAKRIASISQSYATLKAKEHAEGFAEWLHKNEWVAWGVGAENTNKEILYKKFFVGTSTVTHLYTLYLKSL